MRVGRKKLSEYFLRILRDSQPKFYRRALELNKADKFVFYSQRIKPNFIHDDTTDTWTDSSSSSSSTVSDTDEGKFFYKLALFCERTPLDSKKDESEEGTEDMS
jgi:hypothetical protein